MDIREIGIFQNVLLELLKFKAIKKRKKICILVSNGMSLTGAPVVLVKLARVCRKLGYIPCIISEENGPLSLSLSSLHIDILYVKKENSHIFDNFMKSGLVAFVVVNTVINYEWVEYFQQFNTKVFWWIHEATTFLSVFKRQIFKIKQDVTILCGSERVKNNLIKPIGDISNHNKLLLYGLDDEYKENIVLPLCEKKVILQVGTFDKRKNQLEFIEAVKNIEPDIRKNAKFILIGSITEESYYKKIKSAAKGIYEIEFHKPVPNKELMRLYAKSDMVVCTSIDDPLPVVLADALMWGKIVITSKNTGFIYLIENGKNGFVYENVQDLTKLLGDLIKGNYDSGEIGKQARQLFLSKLELHIFAKNFKKILKETI